MHGYSTMMEICVIDFHSHMLPGIDDGSPDENTSLAMLRMAAEQGVHIQVLTPHYYPWRESMEHFLKRRWESCVRLKNALTPGLPKLLVGAETAFFNGMSKENLTPLCIGSSRVILVELPFESWDGRIADEIATMSLDKGYQVVLAHVERYLGFKNNPEMLESLARLPIHMQINAETFLHLSSRRKGLELVRSGRVCILGSDAHNCDSRKPNLAEGRRYLEKKLGSARLRHMDEVSSGLLQKEFAVR